MSSVEGEKQGAREKCRGKSVAPRHSRLNEAAWVGWRYPSWARQISALKGDKDALRDG